MIPDTAKKKMEGQIKKSFCHRMDVYGFADDADETAVLTQKTNIKYSGLPCRLTRISSAANRTRLSLAEEEIFDGVEDSFLLFTKKGIRTKANDLVRVTTENGVYEGRCGDAHFYDTHTEMLFRTVRKA